MTIHLPQTFGVTVLLAVGTLASAPGRVAAGQSGVVDTPLACDEEQKQAIGATADSNAPEVRAMRNEIGKAIALFRFHRPADAQVQIDRAAKRLERRPNLLTAGSRSDWTIALAALRRCTSAASPPAMATLTVQALKIEGTAYGPGVYIRVDEIPIGRTAANGTLQAQVPSGAVRITAIVPPTSFGEAFLTLTPGSTASQSITLDPDKEPAEETDLVLVEAHDDVMRRTAPSFTLQFLRDDRRVPLRGIEAVELLNQSDVVDRELRDLFKIAGGAIVALDVPRLLTALAQRGTSPIRLRVTAIDTEEFIHCNIVELRLE